MEKHCLWNYFVYMIKLRNIPDSVWDIEPIFHKKRPNPMALAQRINTITKDKIWLILHIFLNDCIAYPKAS